MRLRYTKSAKRAAAFDTEDEARVIARFDINGEVLYSRKSGGFIVWSHRHLKWIAEPKQEKD